MLIHHYGSCNSTAESPISFPVNTKLGLSDGVLQTIPWFCEPCSILPLNIAPQPFAAAPVVFPFHGVRIGKAETNIIFYLALFAKYWLGTFLQKLPLNGPNVETATIGSSLPEWRYSTIFAWILQSTKLNYNAQLQTGAQIEWIEFISED